MLGTGLLAIWNDIAASEETAFNRWYRSEHLHDRVSLPGFMRGRRYVALEGAPKYAALYEGESPAVFQSDAYTTSLNNPSPETLRIMPHFQNMSRTVCTVAASFGTGAGGDLACYWLSPPADERAAFQTRLVNEALPAIADADGIVSAHLGVGDASMTKVDSAEASLRDGPDVVADWIVLVDAIDGDSLDQAIAQHLNWNAMGNGIRVTSARYRLVHTVSAADYDG